MRAALLIAAILAGQAHACWTVWFLPNGKACGTCPTLPCPPEMTVTSKVKATVEVSAKAAQDCRACCSLSSCEDKHPQAALRVAGVVQIDLCLPGDVAHVEATSSFEPEPFSVHVQRSLPNAPPLPVPSRAPPFQLN